MPLYDYECEKCGHKFEHSAKLSEYDSTHEIKCEKCGQTAKRKLSATRTASQTWSDWRS